MKIKSSALLLFVFAITAVMSCSAPKALEYQSYKNFNIVSLGFSSSTVKFDLRYFNPNGFGLQLRRADLDIYVNNTFLGHSVLDTLINIPRRDTFSLPVQFDVDMKNLFKNAVNTLIQKEILVKVTGKLKVGKANVFMSFPVNYEGKHAFSIF